MALAFALATCSIAETPTAKVVFVAHRGESADAPENTLSAFRLAWQRRDQAFELDVHLTSDGQLIVSHDGNTRRTTGVNREIAKCTAEELRALDAGKWKSEKWTGEKLPFLSEALATIPKNGRCFIEVKVGPEAIGKVAQVIRETHRKPEQIAIISFNAKSVEEAKRQMPDIPAYLLASFRQDPATGTWSPSVDELIATAKTLHLDGLDLAAQPPIDAEFVSRVKAAGLGIYVWTIDDPVLARKMIDAGVQGITSNKAAWLRRECAKQ